MPESNSSGGGTSKVIHLSQSDLGPHSEAMVDFARQQTVEEKKFNIVSLVCIS